MEKVAEELPLGNTKPRGANPVNDPEPLADPLPLSVAGGVSQVPRRSAISRAPTVPSQVLRHMRHYPQVPARGHEPARVKPFVASHRHRLRSRDLLQHYQGRVAFRGSVGLEHFRVHDQPVAVLHQKVPAVTQLGLLAVAFARQLSFWITLRLMCL